VVVGHGFGVINIVIVIRWDGIRSIVEIGRIMVTPYCKQQDNGDDDGVITS
jgi:hypothetical protein